MVQGAGTIQLIRPSDLKIIGPESHERAFALMAFFKITD